MSFNELGPSSSPPSDARIDSMKEYMQIFSSHFRDAINNEVAMFTESVANYLRHTSVSGEFQMSNTSEKIKNTKDGKEDVEHLKVQLNRAHALLHVYKSALKLFNAATEMYLARDCGFNN